MVKLINLTQNKVAIVDDEDYEKVNQFKWYCSSNGYAVRNIPHKKNILMHRFILNAPASKKVDHINLNKLDDRKENLRLVSNAETGWNVPGHRDSSSKYKGVSWCSGYRRWRAQITVNSKRTFLGWFKNEDEAALAYNEAARHYFKEFAYLNNIERR